MIRDAVRHVDVARLACRFVEIERRVSDVRLIIEKTRPVRGFPVLDVAADAPALDEVALDRGEGPRCGGDPRRLSEGTSGVGERADEEAVPAREDLVVARRAYAKLARGEHLRLGSEESLFDVARARGELERDVGERLRVGEHGGAALLEVTVLGDAEVEARDVVREGVVADCGAELGEGPDEEFPFDALGVGVLRCVESACFVEHFGEEIADDLARRVRVPRLAEGAEAVDVEAKEEGVIVEHLLEMRDEPALVGRVTMEAPAEVIPDASRAHPIESARYLCGASFVLLEDAAAKHHIETHGVRKFRALPEAAVLLVEAGEELSCGEAEQIGGEPFALVARGDALHSADRLSELLRLEFDLGSTGFVGVGDRVEDPRKARHAVAIFGREVRPREEGALIGRQKDGERPAPAAAHELNRELVDLIEIGALFAVYFYADEELVHALGDGRVLERLTLHDVAPMAGGVADGEEDRLVFGLRLGERVIAPGVPIDRVLGVLEEVRG